MPRPAPTWITSSSSLQATRPSRAARASTPASRRSSSSGVRHASGTNARASSSRRRPSRRQSKSARRTPRPEKQHEREPQSGGRSSIEEYVARFAARVRELYPGTPEGRETQIAEHACRKYSGRVGRSGAAKALDEDAVRLAVVAHVRHTETAYDDLLLGGCERGEARARVRDQVAAVLSAWQR